MEKTLEIKQWIRDNPLDAKNKEDLYMWTCDTFDLDDEYVDMIWRWVDKLQPLLPS